MAHRDDISGKRVRIVRVADLSIGPDGMVLGEPEYLLLDAAGNTIARDAKPTRLAALAFCGGALEVRHDYDLSKAEE